ncbi:winged helix-turn-helix transcriptional regulator [Nocardia sp. 2]|uniref:Winged helix-turn-helix transcriptional regulator n=1 Tax=Nocardia acididurans TaxID=2802282 RepID=A0ABS1M5D7_9NOCA|nr:winged helix-turn-helix domain-containing protein [Nocardia acididurans]MBL1075385.1 winged helix-turn-helix transcriptional regulator [Nocardia acididurans]
MSKPTVVDAITEELAYRVAAGVYPPGALLPSVRQLAVEFSASTPTANSALGRLAALGFAEARRGLGYVVRDIRMYGGIDTWRYLLRFAHRVPDQAAKLFADIIDVDHLLVMDAVRTFVDAPERYDITPIIHAADRMELLVSDSNSALTDIMAAELHLLRCAFAALGKPGVLSLFNTIGEVLVTVPEAAQAFYEPLEPAGHVLLARKFQEIRELDTDVGLPDLSVVELLMREYHNQVIAAFRDLITKKAIAAE